MSAREIDAALKVWNERLGMAAQNLMDLQAQPTYRRLTNGSPPLTGKTAAQASIAVNTVAQLLEYYELLRVAIARAEELRADLPVLFNSEQREREIQALLTGPSIRLPAVGVPLEKRGLLGTIEHIDSIPPAGLLQAMEKAFEAAKAIVLAIDASYESLGRTIEFLENKIRSLNEEGELHGEAEWTKVHEAAAKLAEVQTVGASDPLGTSEQIADMVTSRVDEVIRATARRRQIRAQTSADLDSASMLLENVQRRHRETVTAHNEASDKIAGFTGAGPKRDAEIEGLADWLGRLRTKGSEGAWEPVSVGLRNWTKAAQDTMQAEIAVLARAKQPLERRAELRGRLDALKAKARALGVAEDSELAALAEEAHALLYNRPNKLDMGAKAVGDYEAKLNSRAQKSVRS